MVRISILLALAASAAHANWWENPKPWWPEYVRCSLAKREVINGQRVCLYLGANNTTDEVYVNEKWSECPQYFMCKYAPKGKRTSIGDIMNSIRDALQ